LINNKCIIFSVVMRLYLSITFHPLYAIVYRIILKSNIIEPGIQT